MKAENLMMQSAPSPKSAGTALRSAVKTQTAAQGAKTDKNDFGSALDNAKNAQQDTRPEPREAGKPETAAGKQPETADAKQAETSAAPETKNADTRETETADVAEKTAEAANELPKSLKKDKPAKADKAENAETTGTKPVAEDTATTLNAMLMAMAGSAQAGTVQVDPGQQDIMQSDITKVDMAQPEVVPTGAMDMPAAEQPAFAPGALDSLLPQDAAKEQQAAQNQKLMDMLSQNGADMRLTDEQLKGFSASAQEVVAAPDTEIVQQPVTNEPQIFPQVQTEEPVVTSGQIVLEQPKTAEIQQDAAILQAAEVPVQARTVVKENPAELRDEKSQSLFAGVPLTVEDAVLDKVQTGVRQDLGDMPDRQPQQQMQEQTESTVTEALQPQPDNPEELRTAARSEDQNGAQRADGAGVLPQGMSFTETMNAAAPAEAAPVQQPADPYNVMQQVVQQARLIRTDADTEMVIRLNPEHLGELTLRVAVTAGGTVNATFHTENEQVRGLLESSMIQLKQELQQQGLKVNNVDVQSGLSEDFFAQSQAGQQGYPQSQHSARNQAAERRAFENDADALTVGATAGGAAEIQSTTGADGSDGVNYLV